ncbi:MAG: protein kinase, partial [Gemmatimonadota bacterium]|nr:protein kinase [Gemmatimonadota bacterium]
QLQSTLGNAYQIERELGGGGMSRVFVATETAFGRRVVIKLLPPELTEGMSVERFKREIALAARLQHPHIVPVHAAGETGGLPYFTMPFVDGDSLRARLLKGGALGVTEAIGVMRDVAKALAYAHDSGVVHRDIKPDNVLLTGGSAVVTDFGVAKALSASKMSAPEGTLTQVGTSLGTPAYMAPEQAAADPDSDHRADIYAFGVMAYEMLAGHPPFHGRTPQKLLAAQMGERPEPIEAARPDLPPLLAQIVMKCLEKEPDQRPQSALDLVRILDTVTSGGGHPAMPAILLGGRQRLATMLCLYVAAFVAVAILTRAAIISIGLPDWVFPGALIVMALGLPVILFTAFVHHGTYRAMTQSALTPGGSAAAHSTMTRLAVKASPWVSWRRTTVGGALALAVFALLVAGFMVMRAMGIGPIGSLLAAGKLSERDRLLVTDFRGGGADSSLSAIVTEAIRTDLGQSSVVSVVSPSSIADALGRMRRDRTSGVDLALAREIAAREGIKGIVDGSVTPLGGGYVVTVRLLEAATGDNLASFRETIDGPKDLLPTLDKLSGQLRGKIGESLKTVRANPPLEQVTTSSLEALRKYAAGMRAFDVEGDLPKSAELFREAVAIDTTFAAAYRKLGAALGNMGMPRESVDSAYRRAYDYRDRLTDVERYLTIGSYFTSGKQRDRKRSADAYEAVLEIDSLNYIALNNLGNVLVTRREFARAEALYRRAIAAGTARATVYTNLVDAQLSQRKFAAAESTAALGRSRFPAHAGLRFMDISMLIARKQLDSLEKRAAETRANHPEPGFRSAATWDLRGVALMRGRINEAARLTDEANALDAARGAPARPHERAMDSAWMDIWHREQPGRGAQTLDATLARIPFRSLPLVDRRYFDVAMFYALAGRPDRARAVIAERNAEVRDTALLRQDIPASHIAMGLIALAEKRPLDALAEFKLGDRLPDGPVNACVRCHLADLAMAYDSAGARDSTIATMERYLALPSTTVWPDANFLAYFHRRLGQLYEARGDSSKAIQHYERFVGLWKNADPELQPKVAQARQRLSVLRKNGR